MVHAVQVLGLVLRALYTSYLIRTTTLTGRNALHPILQTRKLSPGGSIIINASHTQRNTSAKGQAIF